MMAADRGTIVLARFRETYPLRRSEWLLAFAMLGMGITYIANPTLFDRPYFTTMERVAPQWAWAWGFVVIGAARLFALIRNGGWRRSPHLRAAGAALAAMGWFQLALAAIQNDFVGQTVWLWPLFFIADAQAAFTAISEAKVNDQRNEAARAGRTA